MPGSGPDEGGDVIQHVALTGRFVAAVEYAAVAHADHVRKGTDVPYLAHLLAVASLVLEHGGDEHQATAAVLHDVVEDRGGRRRLEDVRARFGPEVARLVDALSDAVPDDDGAKAPWRDRKERYLAHLHDLVVDDHPAVLVSVCDKLHNARAIVADATDPDGPGHGVWERFRGSPSEVAWYYRALVGTFGRSRTLPRRAVRSLEETVEELELQARQDASARFRAGRTGR
jgi:hypothetical protein